MAGKKNVVSEQYDEMVWCFFCELENIYELYWLLGVYRSNKSHVSIIVYM